jgi:ABC-2 type transport system permease protein
VRQALAVGRKELRQIVRDRRTLVILLLVPVFFLLLFGYALNWDIRHVRLAVDDRDHSSASRSLIAAFVNSGYFDLASVVGEAGGTAALEAGDARAVLVIPPRMGADLRAGRGATVQVLVNGDNANTATAVVGYATSILQFEAAKYSRPIGVATASAGGASGGPIAVVPRVWYNPELRSTFFLVPGLIAYIAMISAAVSTALSVVREKERGTMEQVRMAPIGASTFIAGKTLPYFLISLLSGLSIMLAAMALFDLPMRGSWLLLIAAMSLFLVGALALGLFISTIAETQQVAFQVAVLASFLPTMLLSGFVFPIASMPAFLRAITYAVPARYFLVALRGIVLKGVGIGIVWVELAALALFAAVVLGLASIRLRRQWA